MGYTNLKNKNQKKGISLSSLSSFPLSLQFLFCTVHAYQCYPILVSFRLTTTIIIQTKTCVQDQTLPLMTVQWKRGSCLDCWPVLRAVIAALKNTIQVQWAVDLNTSQCWAYKQRMIMQPGALPAPSPQIKRWVADPFASYHPLTLPEEAVKPSSSFGKLFKKKAKVQLQQAVILYYLY